MRPGPPKRKLLQCCKPQRPLRQPRQPLPLFFIALVFEKVAWVKCLGYMITTAVVWRGHSEHLKRVKTVWRPGLRFGPCWGSLQRSPDPLVGGEGLAALPMNPTPALGLWVEVSFTSIENNPGYGPVLELMEKAFYCVDALPHIVSISQHWGVALNEIFLYKYTKTTCLLSLTFSKWHIKNNENYNRWHILYCHVKLAVFHHYQFLKLFCASWLCSCFCFCPSGK